jgi:hypothetical protein
MPNNPSAFFKQAADVQMLVITAILTWCVLQWNLPNLGNNLTPRNFFVAAMLCLACASCWSHVFACRHIRWTPVWGLLLIPPMVMGFHASWMPTGTFPHYPWLAGLMLGLMACFSIGLSQLAWTRSQWLSVSHLLLSGTSMLCLVTLLSPEYLAWNSLWFSLPLPLRASQGGFQQPNLLASFLATAIIFSLWQQLRQEAPIKGWRAIGLLSLTVLHVFIVFKSGSRVGILGLSGSMVLLGIWVHIRSPHNRQFGCLCLISLLLAALLAAWLGDVVHRLQDVFRGHSTTYRLSFIQASTHLWWESPWWGHGLGTFSEKIVPAFIQLIEAGNSLYYTPNLGHPHNEVLLWAVETGAMGVLLIMGPWVFVMVWFSLHQAWNSLAWLACLLPISLHQFTEFPFHSSTAHIWLWCMVLVSGMPSPALRHVQWMARPWIKKGFTSAICALAFGAALMLVDTGWVSYQTWKHRPDFIHWGDKNLLLPVEREFHHPVLKTFATDQFNAINAPRRITEIEETPIHGLCDDIFQTGKRWQNHTQWTLENDCLRQRGDEAVRDLHQRKVQALTKSP